jgi:hypothetical protein
MEPRNDVRMLGPAELKGRLAFGPVGDKERPFTELFRIPFIDRGLSSMDPSRIDRFIVYRPFTAIRGRDFLNELEESLALELIR